MTWLVLLLLVLAGCGPGALSTVEPSLEPTGTPVTILTDVIGHTCTAEKYLVGVLTYDPKLGVAIQDDQGNVTRLMWPMAYSARLSPGGEIEILDKAALIGATGRRYKVGGSVATWYPGDPFWVCAGKVVAQ